MAPRSTTPKKRGSGKSKKKQLSDVAKQPISDEDREPGVVYIGHIPHGFYEPQLKKYFSQFGKVMKVKVSRSPKNGKCKGYAFVKFRYAAVAKTVAETCNNYLFFNKLLKCEFKKLDEIHEDTFHTYRWKQNNKAKRQHNSDKSDEKLVKSVTNATKKQAAKLKKLEEMGIKLSLEDVMDVPKVPELKIAEKDTEKEAEEKSADKPGKGKTSSVTASTPKAKRGRKSLGDDDEPIPTSTSKRRKLEESEEVPSNKSAQKTPTPKKIKKGQSPNAVEKAQSPKIVANGLIPKAEKAQIPKAEKGQTPKAEKGQTPKAEKVPTPKAEKVPTPKAEKGQTPKIVKGQSPKVKKGQTPNAKPSPSPKSKSKTPPSKVGRPKKIK